jgi:unsaturated rhamnogalacturonyl hydrolase
MSTHGYPIGKTVRCVLGGAVMAFAFAGSVQAQNAPRDILKKTELVANWELEHPANTSIPVSDNSTDPLNWVAGAFYTGLTALADRSGDSRYANAIFALGEREGWKLGPRPFHADDYEVAQNWIWAYNRKHDPRMIAAVRQRFDAILKANPSGSLLMAPTSGAGEDCTRRWCWSDALFMGPPGWVALTATIGDPRYLAYADKEYRATAALLFDQHEALFYRDSTYMGRKGSQGEKIFWSRGNGWAYAGLARILTALPPDSASRGFYVDLFLRMSRRIVALQKPDGSWPPSLLDPRSATPPETSGTGFFTFGLAWGVKAGLLKDDIYRRAAEHGWNALSRAVRADGRLGWVQQQDAEPNAVRAEDTQPFGVGAFLLAGAAMYDLALPH